MSLAFIKGVKDNLPNAKITFDKFHNRVGGVSRPRPPTPPYVRCRIRRFQLSV